MKFTVCYKFGINLDHEGKMSHITATTKEEAICYVIGVHVSALENKGYIVEKVTPRDGFNGMVIFKRATSQSFSPVYTDYTAELEYTKEMEDRDIEAALAEVEARFGSDEETAAQTDTTPEETEPADTSTTEETTQEETAVPEEMETINGKRNSDIILTARVSLMNEGHIHGTGKIITVMTPDGEKEMEEPEDIKTLAGWKEAGRKIHKGEKAVTKLEIWKPFEKKNGKIGMRKITAAFFSYDQTEPLSEK